MSMNYKERLKAAADFVISSDHHQNEVLPLNYDEIGIKATLKPHQIEGVSWLIQRYLTGVNVILGDEMGLGKTLQAITFLSYLKFHLKSPGPFLVICPLSVTDGWVSEIAKFCPKLRVLRYVGDKEVRRDLRRKAFEQTSTDFPFDVLLTTYDIVLMDKDFVSQIPWHYAVIDEAQRLKNPSSVLYNVLEQLFVIPRRLLITGTPIQNNLSELWSLMHFCMPMVFGTLEQFLSTFKEAGDLSTGLDAAMVKEGFKTLKYILRAFMLRRTKAMLVECGTLVLPRLTEMTVMAPLVALQKKVYLSILRKELPKLIAFSSGASSPSLQNIVIQLRKACSHPYLFPGIEHEPYEEGEHLVQASGKLLILDHLLQKLHNNRHRVLLFSQMTHTLDILQDYLELREYTYERLDGSVRAEERFGAIRRFSEQPVKGISNSQNDHNGAFVFLISTRAGGVGLNLVGADTVIFYEQDWNPQVDKQALQRVHRIGQINPVLSINLVTARTVEEVIMRRAERKLQLSHNVVGDDDMSYDQDETGADVGDLRSVIFGLHMFDLTNIDNENPNEVNTRELISMAEKVTKMRHESSDNQDRKFELDSMDVLRGDDFSTKRTPAYDSFDPGLDEASYLSWVEKFKEASQATDNSNLVLGKRNLPDERIGKLEAAKRKAEEKKLLEWETLGYQSLAITDVPVCNADEDMMLTGSGSVQFVYGDCTDPSKVCPSEPAIIFSCVDNSGNWGRGGMFDALAKLSASIPEAYHRASEFGDLHMGDLHLIQIKIDEDQEKQTPDGNDPMWVALAVVQSYNARRKVPRSDISIPDLETSLSKASYAASQHSASIHLPRIGYQSGNGRSEWYTVERLLRKYASMYGIRIFVYYFRRSG